MKILNITTSHPIVIQTLVSCLKKYVLRLNIRVFNDDKRKHIKITESSSGPNSGLVNIFLEAKNFDRFESSLDDLNLCVNSNHMHKILNKNRLQQVNKLTLYITDKEKNKLKIKMEDYKDETIMIKSIPLLAAYNNIEDFQKRSYPDIVFDAVVSMDSQYFSKLCKNAYDGLVKMRCTQDSLTLNYRECNGSYLENKTETLTTRTNYKTGVCEIYYKCSIFIERTFDLGLFRKFTKCNQLCNDIEMYIKEDGVLCIRYTNILGRMLICTTNAVESNEFNNDKKRKGVDIVDDDMMITKKQCI